MDLKQNPDGSIGFLSPHLDRQYAEQQEQETHRFKARKHGPQIKHGPQKKIAPRRNPPPSLETLAVELRLAVLKSITEPATLRALVHASPLYHCLYTCRPVEFWTRMAYQTMTDRDIRVMRGPWDCFQVALVENASLLPRQKAILEQFLHDYSIKKPDLISIDVSKAIMQMADLMCWRVIDPAEGRTLIELSRKPLKDYRRGGKGPTLTVATYHHNPNRVTEGTLGVDVQKKLFPKGYENYHLLGEGEGEFSKWCVHIAETTRMQHLGGVVFSLTEDDESEGK